ncbi:zinc finger domain-containing protein [Acidicapsa dinghuensis]
MKIRRDYQIPCPACHARTGRPCQGKQGERLHGVHFQRTTALRAQSLAAFKSLYAPLTARTTIAGR